MKIYHFTTGPIMVNTYLVFDENGKAFLVDPGDYSSQIADKIEEEKLDVEYILLTHGHADHIGGVDGFRKLLPNVKVVACEDEKELLEDPYLNSSPELYGRSITVHAVKYVGEGDSMTIGDMTVFFRKTPGHSPGGMIILTDGVCFSGDTLFRASVGRTDFYGGSFPVLIQSIRNVLFALPDDTIVLPGHMGQTTIGFEKENNTFVI